MRQMACHVRAIILCLEIHRRLTYKSSRILCYGVNRMQISSMQTTLERQPFAVYAMTLQRTLSSQSADISS